MIVDWKTGRGEGRFNEVQVAGYALYATEKGWVGDPEEISTELNYLVIPRATRRAVTKAKIESVRGFIERSARDMKALLLDPVENRRAARGLPDDRPAAGLPALQLPAAVLPARRGPKGRPRRHAAHRGPRA